MEELRKYAKENGIRPNEALFGSSVNANRYSLTQFLKMIGEDARINTFRKSRIHHLIF